MDAEGIDAFAEKLQADIADEVTADDESEDVVDETEVEDVADDEKPVDEGDDGTAETVEDEADDAPVDDGEQGSDDDDIYAELLKDEPEAAKAEVTDALASENEQLKQQINELTAQIIQGQGLTPPDRNLMNPDHESYDPDEYNRQFFRFQEGQEKYTQVVQAQQQVAQEQVKQYLGQRDSELKEALPIWFDKERGNAVQNKMREAALAADITEQQFEHLPAKALVLIDQALRYRAGLARLEKAKTTKPASKIVRKSSRKGPGKAEQAKTKLKTSGKESDFSAKWLAETEG